jgi:hypothetical protein
MAGYEEPDVRRELEQQNLSNLSLAGGAILFWNLMVVVAVRNYRRDGGQDWWEPVA